MRAVRLTRFDGPGAVEVVDVEDPPASDDSVVVDIRAAALGAWDVMTTRGAFLDSGGNADLPQVLGWDFAGIVRDPGPSSFSVGDAVYGFSPQPWSRIGVFAERAALPADFVAAAPVGWSAVDTATLPVTALTARLLLNTAHADRGDTVLIIGAAGAVGGATTQLAVARGCTVLGSADRADASRLGELGAAHAIDRAGDVAAQARAVVPEGVDVVIDLVGGEPARAAVGALRDGARFVSSIAAALPPQERDIELSSVGVTPDREGFAEVAELAVRGTLTAVPVARVVPLQAAAEAFAALASGSVKGKVVLSVED